MKELAVTQINAYLTVPVQVKEIDFSLLRKFPYATVDLSDVSTKGALTKGCRDPLLEAGHIFFQFSWFDIFKDNVRLKRISVEDATCVLFVDEEGKRNYNIFKERKSTDSSSAIDLEEILLINTGIRYISRPGTRDFSFRALNMKWKGRFSSESYELSGVGPLFVERLMTNDVNYISNKLTDLNVQVMVNTREGRYQIMNSVLRIEAMDLTMDGFIRENKKGATIDLNVKSKEAGLEELLSLLPGLYPGKLQKYKYEGNGFFDLHIVGDIGESKLPLVTAAFGTDDASIMPKGSSYRLSHIRLKGSFTNRISVSNPVERLTLNKMEAMLEGQSVRLSLLMEDFSNPYINLSAESKINLEVLSRFYMPDTLSALSGELMVNAKIRGRTNNTAAWISEGTVQASNVSFTLKECPVPFTAFNGGLTLRGNRLFLDNLSGKAAGSDMKVNGFFDNAYAFLLTSDAQLYGEANLTSNNLDLNEFIQEKSASSDTGFHLDISNRMNLNLGLSIGIFTFGKFQAWQLKGKVDIRNSVLSTEAISFKAFDGYLALQGRVDASRTDSVLIACDADVKKLDVTELFTQMGNFGQQVMKDENVKGKLTARVQFASIWSKDLHCNFNKVYAKSKLLIEKGELNNFQPMLLLSKYLKSADLNKIKFETLENEIEISNRTIFIPAMEIKSSVMDLTASGTHTFDNIVDYKLQLYLSQLFGKKVRSKSTEFGTIEDDGLGRMRLFLTMKGPLAAPTIVYDRKGIEQKVTHAVKQEKQDLKKILHQEFGWFKKDTSVVKGTDNQPKKQEELELELEPE